MDTKYRTLEDVPLLQGLPNEKNKTKQKKNKLN